MNYDFLFLEMVQSFSNPFLDGFFFLATELGSYPFWFAVVALIYWSGREKKGLMLASLVLTASVIAGAMKLVFHRPRPSKEEFRVLASVVSFSYPSGHSAVAASAAAFLDSHKHLLLSAFAVIAVLLAAYSRMYLGVHFLSDVIGGTLLGLTIGWGFTKLYSHIEASDFSHLDNDDRVFYLFIIVASVIALVFARSVVFVAAMLGFFIGFILHRETRLECNKIMKGKALLLRELNGFNGLLLIGAVLVFYPGINYAMQLGLLFLAGFWVSYLFPMLYERIVQKMIPTKN